MFLNIPSYGAPNFKSSTTTFSTLPAFGNSIGDVRTVEDTGIIYYWNGSAWISASGGGGGTVTAVTATGPLVSSGGTTPNISITGSSLTEATSSVLVITGGSSSQLDPTTIQVQQASGSQSGYLSSTDWNTFNNKQVSGSYITALTGDVTASGPGSSVASLTATTNSTLVTLSGLTTASSLSTVGTISSGTWNGTTIALNHGGTGQTTASAAFNALSPMTTVGDLIYGGVAGAGTRLGIGSTGQVLTVSGGNPAWETPSTGGAAEYNNGNSGTSANINFNNGNFQRITLNNNATITFSNPVDATLYRIRFIQDSTGGWVAQLPTNISYPGGHGVVWSKNPGLFDEIQVIYSGGEYHIIDHQMFDPNAISTAYSLVFDGSTTYVTVPPSPAFATGSSGLTIGVWANWTGGNIASQAALLECASSTGDQGTIFRIGLTTANKLGLYVGSASTFFEASDTTTLNTSLGWEHYAVTYDGNTTVKFYINGALSSTQTVSAVSAADSGNVLKLGADDNSPISHYFKGHMGDVVYYLGALTGAQIADIYNFGRPPDLQNASTCSGFFSSAIAWWRLGEPLDTITSFTDYTGHGHNGTNGGIFTIDTSVPNAQNPFSNW